MRTGIFKLFLIVGLLLVSVFSFGQKAAPKSKTWVVDIFIQTYYVNGKPVDAYTDNKGNTRHSWTFYYAKTVKKGDDGQAVQYRFNLETVNLKMTKENSLVFKNSSSELIGQEHKDLIDILVNQLPVAYTSSIARKLSL